MIFHGVIKLLNNYKSSLLLTSKTILLLLLFCFCFEACSEKLAELYELRYELPFCRLLTVIFLRFFNCAIKKSQVPNGSTSSKFRDWLMAVRNDQEKLISN